MGLFNDAKKNLEDAKRRLASVSGLDSKEAREGITQIKNGISKIGHQLKDVDKSSVQSVQASIDSGVDKASRSKVLQSAADSDPGRSSGRASSILDHTNEPIAGPASSGKKDGIRNLLAHAPFRGRSAGVAFAAKAGSRPMLIAGFAAIALLLVIGITIGSCSGKDDAESQVATSENLPLYSVGIHLVCEENVIFSKYNMAVYVDDTQVGTLEHGKNGQYSVRLEQGNHTLRLKSESDESIEGTAVLEISQDEDLHYRVHCSSGSIEIERMTADEANEQFAEELRAIVDHPGEKAAVVIGQLEAKDYKGNGYSLACLEGGKALENFNADEYGIESGEVDAESRSITLRLKSTKAIEPSYEKELAMRVVVVAMTNCWASDVYGDDGNYDVTKFHSYADITGYYLTVIEEGSWSGASEDTWHVDNMRLQASEGLCLELSADVSFDGENYVVSSATVTYGNSFEDIESGNEWSVSTENYDPSDSSPFLTVAPSLVEAARDEAAASAQESERAAEKAEQIEYTNWVDSQFSWWDGKNDAFVDLVKSNLNDERSFDHIETRYIAIQDESMLADVNAAIGDTLEPAKINDVYIVMDFSAKNGFNATIKKQAAGIIRYPSGNVELLAIY